MSARKTRLKNVFSQLELSAVGRKKESGASPAKTRRLTRSASFGGASGVPKSDIKEVIAEIDLTEENETVFNEKIYSENWIEGFAPSNVEELAVHPKKLQELQSWLLHCDAVRKKFPAQVCLLTGPSGCGKTAVLRVCAEANKYEVQEWVNPIDQETVHFLGEQTNGEGYVGSQTEAFKSFLVRASRYKSLFAKFSKTLLLVEDFPNALVKDPASFETILMDYMNYGKSPLVFIVADSKSKSLNISYNLFTEQVKVKCRIEHISFNPIASTLMQKAMKRFCSIMKSKYNELYKVPSPDILDSIILSSQGDIRNALINLHFTSLKGAPNVELVPLEKTKEKSKKKKEKTLKSVGRDESITMMHALGRVFNPKYTENGNLSHCPEDITEQFITEPKKLTDFLHANYLPHFKDISNVVKTIDCLTLADTMLSEYRNDSCSILGLNLAIRSMMVSNTTPISGWLPVHGPKRIIVPLRPSGEESHLMSKTANTIMKTYTTDYSTFLKILSSKSFTPNGSLKTIKENI